MMRFFNTAGPCKPDIHYMLPSSARLPEARRIIAQQGYFVLHAPRRSGKTTALLTLAQELLAEGRYGAVLLSLESGGAVTDLERAEIAILSNWRESAAARLPADLQPPDWPAHGAGGRLRAALQDWATVARRPLVLFLEEVDALAEEVLLSVLRQFRDGYTNRPTHFPWSLALIGVRDVRGHEFNIKMRSLTLGNFTAQEVATLYGQHTADTGQAFTTEAITRAFHLTQGQPYLVNALAKAAVEELLPESQQSVTTEHIEQSKDILVQHPEKHLDSLAAWLQEDRVRAVIEPLMAGDASPSAMPADNIRFVVELGLARYGEAGRLAIANPIYGEVISRVLTTTNGVAPQRRRPAASP